MKSKGFTIVELLATIAILAIVALIATPIIMNVVESNKREAAEASIANIEHAADIYYYENGGISEVIFNCDNDVCSNGENNLDIKGTVPESGQIIIDEEGNITLKDLIINGYLCYKKDNMYTCEVQ